MQVLNNKVYIFAALVVLGLLGGGVNAIYPLSFSFFGDESGGSHMYVYSVGRQEEVFSVDPIVFDGKVLAAQTNSLVGGKITTNTGITESDVLRMIDEQVNVLCKNGLLAAGICGYVPAPVAVSPAPIAAGGSGLPSSYFPPVVQNNFSGSTVFSATNLSSNSIAAQVATLGELTVSGQTVVGSLRAATTTFTGSVSFASALSPFSVNGALQLGAASTTTGSIVLYNATNGFTTTIQSSSTQDSNLTFVLPNATGTPGQVLATDGTGVTYWSTGGGGGGSGAVNTGVAGYFGYYPSNGTTIDDQTRLFLNGSNINIGTTTGSSTLSLQGTGSINPFSITSSSGASLLTVLPSGNVGLGTSNPTDALDITGDTSTSRQLVIHNNYAVGAEIYTHAAAGFRGPSIALMRSQGTQSVPSAVQNGDKLGYFQFFGHDGSGYVLGASVESNTSNTWSTGNTPAYLFFTTNNGTERMRIDAVGKVSIASSTAHATLFVQGIASSTLPAFSIVSSTGESLFTVSPSGNIGIGTTTSTNLFHMVGSIGGNNAITHTVQNTNNGGRALFYAANDLNNGFGFEAIGSNVGGLNLANAAVMFGGNVSKFVMMPDGSVASGGTAPIVFRLGGWDITNDRAIFTSIGSYGFGTTTPLATLHVQGLASSSLPAFTISSSTGASVFRIQPTGTTTVANLNASNCDVLADTSGNLYCGTNGGNVALSSITAATASSTIDNTNTQISWNWSTLAASGLVLNATSTAAAGNSQKLLTASLQGANSTASQTTYAGYFTNTHTGTGAVNVALYANANGASTNYAAIFENGYVGIGPGATAPGSQLVVSPYTSQLTYGAGTTANQGIAIINSYNFAGRPVGVSFGGYSGYTFGGIYGIMNDSSGNTIGDITFAQRASTGATEFTEAMRLTTAGNLGIGTVSPSTRLSVTGTNSVDPLDISSTSGTSLVRVTQAGNIGIGTTTPGRTLSVIGDIRATGVLYDSSNSAGSTGAVLQSTGTGYSWVSTTTLGISGGSLSGGSNGSVARWTSSTAIATSTLYDNGTVAGVRATSSSYSFNIQGAAGTDPFNISSSTGTALVTVTQTGRLGIGTATPAQLLTVSSNTGSAIIGIQLEDGAQNGSSSRAINWRSTMGTVFDYAKIRAEYGNSYVNSKMIFSTGNSSSVLTDRMVIDVDGDVGVQGNTTPGSPLSFAGSTGNKIALYDGGASSYGLGIQSNLLQIYSNIATDRVGIGYGGSSASFTEILSVKSPGIGIGQTSPSSRIHIAGNLSASEWSLNGLAFNSAAVTYTNSSSINGSSAVAAIHSFGQSNLASSNTGVTHTSAYNMYIGGAPISASNQTITNTYALRIATTSSVNGTGGVPTNSYGLYVDAQAGATNNYAAVFMAGNVGIGTTSPAFPMDIYSSVSSSQTYGYLNSSGSVGTSTGSNSYSLRARDRVLASEFNAVSDMRLKDIQFTLDGDIALDAISHLQPVSFTWKTNPTGQPKLGFLAQEVEAVIPNAVSKLATENFPDQRELDYNQILSVAVGAIKQLNTNLVSSQESITALQSQVSELELFSSTTPIVLKSHLYLSSDSVGAAKILSGDTKVRVTFDKPYEYMPIVTVTPEGENVLSSDIKYTIVEKDAYGFSIKINTHIGGDLMFNWHAFASKEAKLTVSDSTTELLKLQVSAPIASESEIVQGGNTTEGADSNQEQSQNTQAVVQNIDTATSSEESANQE